MMIIAQFGSFKANLLEWKMRKRTATERQQNKHCRALLYKLYNT